MDPSGVQELLEMMFKEWSASRSPLSSYGMEGRHLQKTRMCANCHKSSKTEKYKVCKRCKELKVPKSHMMYVHYCGKDCQRAHWKIHRFEHTKYESQQTGDGLMKKYGYRHDRCYSSEDEKPLPVLLEMQFKENPFIERQEILDELIFKIDQEAVHSLQEINDKWYAEIEGVDNAKIIIKEGIEYESRGVRYMTYPQESDDF